MPVPEVLHSARGESRTRTRLPSADFESDGLARPRDTSGITVRQDNGLGPGGLPIDDGWCRVVRGTVGAQRPVTVNRFPRQNHLQ